MEPDVVVKHLKSIPLFRKIDTPEEERELYFVVPLVQEIELNPGDFLFTQGESSTRLYLILNGALRMSRIDQQGVVRELGEREVGFSMGETGVMVGDFHDVTAEVIEPSTRLLYMEQADFQALLKERPKLRRALEIREDVLERHYPERFAWMRDDESIIFLVRRHWFHLVRRIVMPAFAAIALWILAALFSVTGPAVPIFFVLVSLPFVGLVIWMWGDWQDDYFALTTQRVIHSEQVWIFRKDFEEAILDNVQDVHEVRPDLMSNVLNYGDLILQSAGETVQIDMVGVPNPDYLREMVFREIERGRARQAHQRRESVRKMLKSRLEAKGPETIKPPVAAPAPHLPLFQVVFHAIRDYWFPESWSVSPDKSTIVWRRYWLPGFFSYLKFSIPLLAVTIGGAVFLSNQPMTSTWAVEVGVWLFVVAILMGLVLWYIEDWRNDYFQITPSRIIEVNRKPLMLGVSRREATLDRIQNISYDEPGIFARIFDYGHVTLETAGTLGKFSMRWLRHPQKVQAEISRRQREYKLRLQQIDTQRRQDELLSWFASYEALRAPQSPAAVKPEEKKPGS